MSAHREGIFETRNSWILRNFAEILLSLLQKRQREKKVGKSREGEAVEGAEEDNGSQGSEDTLAPSQKSGRNEVSHPKLYYKEELSKRENQNYYINIQKNKK